MRPDQHKHKDKRKYQHKLKTKTKNKETKDAGETSKGELKPEAASCDVVRPDKSEKSSNKSYSDYNVWSSLTTGDDQCGECRATHRKPLGADFTDLLEEARRNKGAHFRFKAEKEWDSIARSGASDVCLDIDKLTAAVSKLPLRERIAYILPDEYKANAEVKVDVGRDEDVDSESIDGEEDGDKVGVVVQQFAECLLSLAARNLPDAHRERFTMGKTNTNATRDEHTAESERPTVEEEQKPVEDEENLEDWLDSVLED